MSLSASDLELLRKTVATTVKQELAGVEARFGQSVSDVWDAIRRLEKVDERTDEDLRKHSGAHRDLSTNVRRSLDEVKVTTLESVDAKLDAFRAEMRAERAELVKAPEAAMQASKSAASAALDTEQIRSKQLAEAHDQRVRFWTTIIPVIAAAVASIAKLFL